MQVGPPRDRRGNPVATPAPSKPPQPRGATRTAILAVCLEFSLPSGTGSLQTASLALPQGRARERGGELSASDWVSGRAAGVSGREWPPGPAFPAALTPMAPPRLSAPSSPLPSWATQRVSGTRGKGSFRTPPFLPAQLAQLASKIETPGAWVQPEGAHKSPGPGALVQRDASHTYTWLGTQVVLPGPRVSFIPPRTGAPSPGRRLRAPPAFPSLAGRKAELVGLAWIQTVMDGP